MPEAVMDKPALKFVETLQHANDLQNLLAQFRDRGFVVLRSVFERDSVDEFRSQVEATVVRDPAGRLVLPDASPLMVWPTRAPRMRAALPGALHHAEMKPHPYMFESAWLISPPGPPVTAEKGWHKDRDHEGMPGREYHYPKDVHIGAYFTDMTPELGPTQAIAGSHRDPERSPYRGDEPVSFLLRKEDVVLWDQRMWHRATSRTEPGLRIFAIFGFCAIPVYGPDQRVMPESQRRAWLDSDDPEDRALYGGTFGRTARE